jgi:hypothetical protein
MALPFQARSVLDNNDSVKTDGLAGLATVEYRFLVPVRRSGVILGNKGGVSGEQGMGDSSSWRACMQSVRQAGRLSCSR